MLKFELKKQFRQSQDILFNLAFFLITATIFVFAVSPNFSGQEIYAAGIILTILLLAILMVVEKNLREDYQDGVLEQLFIFDRETKRMILAKYTSFVILAAFLLLFSPLALYAYGLTLTQIKVFLLVTMLMLPLICAICFLGSVFTFKLSGKTFLIFIIILPMLVPEVIFIMLTLNNYYQDNVAVNNYLEYMLYFNLVLLPLCYFLAIKMLKLVIKS